MNSPSHRNYINVDELIERTPLDAVLSHYNLPLTQQNAAEYRMECVFGRDCESSTYGNLSVEMSAAKRVYTHCCQVRGNLLTLIHGLETGKPPTDGRLRGQEFKDAAVKLREISGTLLPEASPPARERTLRRVEATPPSPEVVPSPRGTADETPSGTNVPLVRHEKEAARALADLEQDLISDISLMTPEAAAYVRQRPWLTQELMRKWGIGWIPGNGRSLFRKNYLVYTHRNTRGEIVSYSGRDINFDTKWAMWLKQGRPEGKRPAKHRYVAGFKRGAELYGGYSFRLEEPQVQESLATRGLVVVEGANDCVRLDQLGVCSVALCSNKATSQQIEMLTRFARQVAGSRVMLIPDADQEGEAGFTELLWQLASRDVTVRVVRTEALAPECRQPEQLTAGLLSQAELEW